MNFNQDQPQFVQERKLVATKISGKPNRKGLIASLFSLAIIVSVTQLYWSNFLGWSEFMPAVRERVFVQGEWWRVFTAIFIHADLGHLLSNIYMLGLFSYFVCSYFGYFIYPVLSFLVSGIVNVIAIYSYPSEVRLLGASGLVYVLGGLWLTLYFLIQRQHKVFNRLLRVTGIALMIFFPSTFSPSTSYRTHAIGFIFGILIGVVYFIKSKRQIRALEIYEFSTFEVEPTSH
ncbi:rhomboid family intramembrane serine protease [Bdellovibrionales bacterium]|nr:rhomboid family intramembrane serine protease [Bdellovibrionales bacterium]